MSGSDSDCDSGNTAQQNAAINMVSVCMFGLFRSTFSEIQSHCKQKLKYFLYKVSCILLAAVPFSAVSRGSEPSA